MYLSILKSGQILLQHFMMFRIHCVHSLFVHIKAVAFSAHELILVLRSYAYESIVVRKMP